MAKKSRRTYNVPWITDDGELDPSMLPIDSVLRQTLSADHQEFRGGCSVLDMMHTHGREEAGIYLLGLLQHYKDDLERLETVVKHLRGFQSKACADALFAELRRVKSSNKTRGYLNTVMEILTTLPFEMIEDGFWTLAEDTSFSYRMRKKFRDIFERIFNLKYGY